MYRCLATVAILVLLAASGGSQQPSLVLPAGPAAPEPHSLFYFGSPLDTKDLAKDKFEAHHATTKVLGQAKVEAARGILQERYRDFLAGRGTLDSLLQAATRLLEAERAYGGSETDLLPIYEQQWMVAREMERISKARYDAARIPLQEYLEARLHRLDMEQKWLEARARADKK